MTYVDLRETTTVAEFAREYAARPHRATTAEHTPSVIDNHIEGTRLPGWRPAT